MNIKDKIFLDKNKSPIGKLTIDKVIFEANYPILFTVKDNKNNLYLINCHYNSNHKKKYVVNQIIKEIIIIKMLQDKITMEEAFLFKHGVKLSIEETLTNVKYKYSSNSQWLKENILPDKGEYIEAEDNEFEEIIEYYK